MKRVNTFVDYRTELVEGNKEKEGKVTKGSSKRAGEELKQENAKNQKMKDDIESKELKQCLEIIPNDGDNRYAKPYFFSCLIRQRVVTEVTNEKVAVTKEKLKEARTRQKSYADKHRRSIEFQPGDRVFLKVSPARGVRRFGIKGKLSPRFIGPFEILDRVGEVSLIFQGFSLDYGCYVNYLSIILDEGASWLYQGIVDFFSEDIAYANEDTITSKVKEAVIQLDSVIQSLPKQVSFGDTTTLNVTVTDGPIMSSTSLLIGIDGLFTQIGNEVTSGRYGNSLLSSSSVCNNPMKMVAISVHEDVLNSASLVYFNANKISWIVDNLPDQKLLNTSGWRFIIPKLYKEFPNDGMSLNFTILSPPTIKVENEGIVATVKSDVFINVVDAGEVIPVACITMDIEASGFAGISASTLSGGINLSQLTMSLKWSNIGTLHMTLVQTAMSTLLKKIIVPVVNLRLRVGYTLPDFHGYGLQNTSIVYGDSKIIVCSDVAQTYEYIPYQIL
uniref:Putative BPI/LBP family protein At1g04970 n=1 Tax=Tanacetum cinerariifolium TaxID=118510 RepID=A0A6L2JQ93_TANCI|nr:putative BPI/LBP family protein At1g04970 [Tanacetum cinerariifolium]